MLRAKDAIKEILNQSVLEIEVERVSIELKKDNSGGEIKIIYKKNDFLCPPYSYKCSVEFYDKLQKHEDFISMAAVAVKFVKNICENNLIEKR